MIIPVTIIAIRKMFTLVIGLFLRTQRRGLHGEREVRGFAK